MSLLPTLEDHHKQLIQYFLHDGAYNEKEIIDLIGALRDRYELKIKVKDELRVLTDNLLPLINKHINQYGIEIKQVTSEEHQQDIYFVCTQNFKPQFVKMDTSYTEKEAAVFEKLLELIITSDEKCVTPREIFESILGNDLKMTQKEFGETMTRFHRDKWIESGPNNTVLLHARAILEMQSFIMDTYRDYVYNCQICTRLLVRGINCSNSSCDIHMHRSCATRYFHRLSSSAGNSTTRKTSYPCPVCKQEWNKDDVVSLLQVNHDNSENSPSSSSSTTTKSEMTNKRQRTSRTSDHNHNTSNRSLRSTRPRSISENEDNDDD